MRFSLRGSKITLQVEKIKDVKNLRKVEEKYREEGVTIGRSWGAMVGSRESRVDLKIENFDQKMMLKFHCLKNDISGCVEWNLAALWRPGGEDCIHE